MLFRSVRAEHRRADCGADWALAVGPVAVGEDGVAALPIAIAGPHGTRTFVHRLGGAADVRLVRAAKTAIDAVRRAASGLPAQA